MPILAAGLCAVYLSFGPLLIALILDNKKYKAANVPCKHSISSMQTSRLMIIKTRLYVSWALIISNCASDPCAILNLCSREPTACTAGGHGLLCPAQPNMR